jgi:hypothetical protein
LHAAGRGANPSLAFRFLRRVDGNKLAMRAGNKPLRVIGTRQENATMARSDPDGNIGDLRPAPVPAAAGKQSDHVKMYLVLSILHAHAAVGQRSGAKHRWPYVW